MSTTSVSLLNRLKAAKPDAAEWRRLQEIYLPLIRAWLARVPALGDELHDLAQNVFYVVIRELPRFERQREGSFRTWLKRVTINRARTFAKERNRRPTDGLMDGTNAFLDRLEDPADDLSEQWNQEHDRHVFRSLVALIEPEFAPATWNAFRLFALEGRPAAEIAAQLNISENAVFLAKSRILKRLRTEAAELID